MKQYAVIENEKTNVYTISEYNPYDLRQDPTFGLRSWETYHTSFNSNSGATEYVLQHGGKIKYENKYK